MFERGKLVSLLIYTLTFQRGHFDICVMFGLTIRVAKNIDRYVNVSKKRSEAKPHGEHVRGASDHVESLV